ncbi:hypothetical protein niasHT_033713 [Heterodera trifolii]|uniref:Polymerase nucleotidyl transferase domain-containing protein n=1 Tax=Heterodera trifolii TaxID=157864 RepID=A0ABD2IH35_9BILA
MEKGGKASAEKEGEKCHRILGTELAKVNLGSFILNSFLHSIYQEFLSNPNESKRCLLDIGVYVNEIWHRMEIIGILSNFTGINELLTENGYTDCPSVELALDKVKQIVSKWSNNEARLLLTGSYALGTHARGSDIDAICIVPQKLGKKEQREHFHGTAFCDLDKKVAQRQCEDNSLYCHFCKEPKIQFLNKIPSAYCPMVQLKLANIEFDLSFVAIPPSADALPNEPIQTNEVERMMAQLANQTIPQEAMLQALSGE